MCLNLIFCERGRTINIIEGNLDFLISENTYLQRRLNKFLCTALPYFRETIKVILDLGMGSYCLYILCRI